MEDTPAPQLRKDKGHFHAEVVEPDEDGDINVNGTLEEVDTAIQERGLRNRHVGYVCSYGCGELHALYPEELAYLNRRN